MAAQARRDHGRLSTWSKKSFYPDRTCTFTSQLGSFCLSEPASGSDAFALQTRAVKDGDHWILNGSKMWITNSYEADFFLIFANIDPSKGYKGITCFVATKDMGVAIAKKEQKLGIRASSTCALSFDDLRVPAENVLGGEGKGYKIAIEILNEGRIGIAAQMLGLAQGAFDKAVPYTFQRSQFGQPIGTFQGMQFQQAEAAIEIETARLLTYNAARRKEEGREFAREAAIAKYVASQVAQKVSGAAIEWAGGVGFTRETGIEKYWRDSKIVSNVCASVVSCGSNLSCYARVRSTRVPQTSSCRLSPSSFKSSTHRTCCPRYSQDFEISEALYTYTD